MITNFKFQSSKVFEIHKDYETKKPGTEKEFGKKKINFMQHIRTINENLGLPIYEQSSK
ncbi:hypothetical protein [Leptospira biflexa]|nr:hypothetical protein [Leptospira biflexa]